MIDKTVESYYYDIQVIRYGSMFFYLCDDKVFSSLTDLLFYIESELKECEL